MTIFQFVHLVLVFFISGELFISHQVSVSFRQSSQLRSLFVFLRGGGEGGRLTMSLTPTYPEPVSSLISATYIMITPLRFLFVHLFGWVWYILLGC